MIPTIAKWTGCMFTERASGSRIVPTMMIAGIASRKQPTTRNAKAMKNPVASTPESIAKGKALYEGKGTCFNCHGKDGNGQGEAGKVLNPSPRDFTNCKFHKKRKDGELFWIIKNGSAGTGMISLAPAIITEEEAWTIINYERTFCKGE